MSRRGGRVFGTSSAGAVMTFRDIAKRLRVTEKTVILDYFSAIRKLRRMNKELQALSGLSAELEQARRQRQREDEKREALPA